MALAALAASLMPALPTAAHAEEALLADGPSLSPLDPPGPTSLGQQVQISGDGSTIVASPGSSDTPMYLVIRRGPSGWAITQTLPVSLKNVGGFGKNVAISHDGTWLATAAAGNSSTGFANKMYKLVGGQYQPVSAPLGGFNAIQETNLHLSSDGSTAVNGHAVLTRSGDTWTVAPPALTPTDAFPVALSLEGAAKAISSDGQTIVAASTRDNNVGAVFTFAKTGAQWLQSGAKLTRAGATKFGASVAMSGDGQQLLVSYERSVPDDSSYSVESYVRSGLAWAHQQTIVVNGPPGVRVSSDGLTAIIGDGRERVYRRSGSTWKRSWSLRIPQPEGEVEAYAISADGRRVAAGDPDAADALGHNGVGRIWPLAMQPARLVTATAIGSGWIDGPGGGMECADFSGACVFPVAAGETVTLTAQTSGNFIGWTGACAGSAAACSLTPTGDVSAQAVFADGAGADPRPLVETQTPSVVTPSSVTTGTGSGAGLQVSVPHTRFKIPRSVARSRLRTGAKITVAGVKPGSQVSVTGRQRGRVRLRAKAKVGRDGTATLRLKLSRVALRRLRAGTVALEISYLAADGAPGIRTAKIKLT